MSASPSPENPFRVIDSKFANAYAPDAETNVRPIGSNRNELMDGLQSNGCRIGIFRPNINAPTGSGLFNVHVWYPSPDDNSPDHHRKEFVVGGDPAHPVGFEVVDRESSSMRTLSEEELSELARTIEGASFH